MPIPPPGDHERDFEGVLRELIREELRDVHTASLAVVEAVDRTRMRVELSLKHDGGVYLDGVPIAAPFANDATGDLPPIREGDEGLAVFTDIPLDDGQLVRRGHVETPQHREHRVEDAIFLPAMVWYEHDTIPPHDHDTSERTVVHPDGGELRMHAGRTEISHGPPDRPGERDQRAAVRVTDDPYFDQRAGDDYTRDDDGDPAWRDSAPHFSVNYDPTHAYDEYQLWPRDGETAIYLDHPSGTHLLATEQGIGVVTGERDDGIGRRGLVCGALNDPDRIHVASHRHILEDTTVDVSVDATTDVTVDAATDVTVDVSVDEPAAAHDENVSVTLDFETAVISIPHSLGTVPTHASVTPRNDPASGDFWVTNKTETHVTVEYRATRAAGTTMRFDVATETAGETTATATADATTTTTTDATTTASAEGHVSAALTTEPLGHREQVAWLTDDRPLANAGTDDLAAATTRAENALAFLDLYAGGAVDPADPASWPDPEYVPPTDEWAAWSDPEYDPLTFEPTEGDAVGLDIEEDFDSV